MDFDSIDIRLFVEVAEMKSLTHGAERSYMSVPAASMRIKTIEEKLGTKLLYRTSQGVTLTPAGQSFLHHGKLLLHQLESLEGDLREYASGVRGCIRIFSNPSAMTEYLPADLRQYLAKHPDVNIELHEHMSVDIVRAVIDGVTDIGIIAGNVATEGLQVLPYRSDRNVIVVSRKHPLAAHKKISFDETLEYDYISLAKGGASHSFLCQSAHAARKTLKVRIQVGTYEALCRMVEMNVGIGLLPASAARRYARTMGIRILDLNDGWAVRDIRICFRDLQQLPTFTRELVSLLSHEQVADSVPV